MSVQSLSHARVLCIIVLSISALLPVGASAQHIILFEDWEQGQGQWNILGGQWAVGTPTMGPASCFSGAACAGTVLDAYYPPTADTRLVSPPKLLQLADPDDRIILEFWHWYSFYGDGCDYGQVEIRVNGGTWKTVSGTFVSTSTSWTRYAIDLSAYADSTVEVAFHFKACNSSTLNPDESHGWFIDDVRIESLPVTFTNPETFENGIGLWYADRGVWEVGAPSAGPDSCYGGTRCAGTRLSSNYPAWADTRLVSPPVLLQLADPDDRIILDFYHWYSFYGDGHDYGRVEIRVNGGAWKTVSGTFVNTSTSWTRYAVDLSAYVDSTVEVAFHFAAGNSSTLNPDESHGWFIDDVRIESLPVTFTNPETFEDGIGLWYADHGIWEVGAPTAGPDSCYGGTRCAGTRLSSNYPAVADTRLVSPPVLLQLADPDNRIILDFWHWYAFWGDGCDYGCVDIRVNGGAWKKVSGNFVNTSTSWTRYAVDLSAYADSTIEVAFHFAACNSSTLNPDESHGWFIDDVRIESLPVTFTNPETFEDGTGLWYADHGIWEAGTPTAGPDSCYEGTGCAGTRLDGNYPAVADTRLVSPPIRLQRDFFNDEIVLDFYHWYSFYGDGCDYGQVEIRVNGGAWEEKSSRFVHSSSGWIRHSVNLTAYESFTVEVAFHFMACNSSTLNPDESHGWFIDRVAIEGKGGAIRLFKPFPRVTAGDSVVSAFSLYNPSSQPVPLGDLAISAPFYSIPESFADSVRSDQIIIPPKSSVASEVVYNPLSGGSHAGTVTFTGTDPADTIAIITARGSARDLDFGYDLDDLYPDRMIDEGDKIFVQLQLADSVEVDSLVVFYAEGGSHAYSGVTANRTTGDPARDEYVCVVPGNKSGSRGVQLYVTAFNGNATRILPPVEPETFRVVIENLAMSNPLPAGEYRIVSIPADMPNNTIIGTIADNLGTIDNTRWRLWAFRPSTDTTSWKYMELPNQDVPSFEQGRAYWIIAKDPVRLDTAPSHAVSTNLDRPFEIVLQPNAMNLVGSPFNFNVPWDSVGVGENTWAEALQNSLIEPPVMHRPVTGYTSACVSVIAPFEGYWVRSNCDTMVTLRIPPTEASPQTRTVAAADHGWRIRIIAETNNAIDGDNFVGVAPDAIDGFDGTDRHEPPPCPGTSVSLYFPRGPEMLTADIRGARRQLDRAAGALENPDELYGHTWRFDIAKNFSTETAGDDVCIRFKGLDCVPADLPAVLVDRTLGRVIDLRAAAEYHYYEAVRQPVSRSDDARFALIVGTENFIEDEMNGSITPPLETALHHNYPNPFNPSTVIRYEIAAACRVVLKIYDIRGALVKTLVDDHRTPGRYEAGWNGDNNGGRRVASGIYLYRLVAGDFAQTRKMVLLR